MLGEKKVRGVVHQVLCHSLTSEPIKAANRTSHNVAALDKHEKILQTALILRRKLLVHQTTTIKGGSFTALLPEGYVFVLFN